MSAFDDAKFTMALGMLRTLYTPQAAADFASYITAHKPDDVQFLLGCLGDLQSAFHDATAAAPDATRQPATVGV